MRLTAVIVTYNRLELLKECIVSLRQQTYPLSEIIVVNNNSSDGTYEWLQTQTNLTIINQDNLGGSGGQYTGIKTALGHKADWVWCMDDDAMPYPDALEKMIPHCTDESIAALACSVIENNGKISLVHRGFYNYKSLIKDFGCQPLPVAQYQHKFVEIEFATFVGIMINGKAAIKIGLPKKELFLHFDDIEYSLRLNTYGKVLLIPDSKILHKENASNHFFTKKVLGRNRIRIKYEKLWLRYYAVRNVTWGVKKYYGVKWDLNLILAAYYLKSIIGILLFDDHKIERMRFFTCAFKDGLSSKFHNGYEYIVNRTRIY
jgi:rhamnopyranosyl-N-acetylglucosaminyl-diphospho-decaprenol beta-1,3/1,4-galactofuranosyltransferase